MNEQEFFYKIEEYINKRGNGSFCRAVPCNSCPMITKCPIHHSSDMKKVFINDFLIKEYERFKSNILLGKLK